MRELFSKAVPASWVPPKIVPDRGQSTGLGRSPAAYSNSTTAQALIAHQDSPDEAHAAAGQPPNVADAFPYVVPNLVRALESVLSTRLHEDATMAGRRSGEGLDSVMQHMGAANRRKEKRTVQVIDLVLPPGDAG